ncbi:MAG: hypothetical protein QM784_08140 [Polyangiaceae bacterium]
MALRDLIRRLEPIVGATLVLEDECILEHEGTATATAYGTVAGTTAFRCDVVVKLLVAGPEIESERVWALVFVFINGKRVAPSAADYMTFVYENAPAAWVFRAWESDVYDEWSDLEEFDISTM